MVAGPHPSFKVSIFLYRLKNKVACKAASKMAGLRIEEITDRSVTSEGVIYDHAISSSLPAILSICPLNSVFSFSAFSERSAGRVQEIARGTNLPLGLDLLANTAKAILHMQSS